MTKKDASLGAGLTFSGNLTTKLIRERLSEPGLKLKEIADAGRLEGAELAKVLEERANDNPLVRELQNQDLV